MIRSGGERVKLIYFRSVRGLVFHLRWSHQYWLGSLRMRSSVAFVYSWVTHSSGFGLSCHSWGMMRRPISISKKNRSSMLLDVTTAMGMLYSMAMMPMLLYVLALRPKKSTKMPLAGL